MNRYEEMTDDDPRREQAECYLNAVVDVFNTGIDTAFRDTKNLLPELKKIGGIEDKPDPEKPPDDFVKRVEHGMVERRQRLDALERLRKKSRR